MSFSVTRTVNAEDLFAIDAKEFDSTAATYAEQFLGVRFDSGRGLFKQTNISTPGIPSRSLLLGGDIRKPECRACWLTVGIKDGGGFQAVWEVPCSMIEGNVRELSLMTRYLRVPKHWGD